LSIVQARDIFSEDYILRKIIPLKDFHIKGETQDQKRIEGGSRRRRRFSQFSKKFLPVMSFVTFIRTKLVISG
jgi:hypothetical protein